MSTVSPPAFPATRSWCVAHESGSREIPGPSRTRKSRLRLATARFFLRNIRRPSGTRLANFTHDSNELITVVEGRLQLTLEGTDMILEPGDEAFIPRNCLHSVINIAPTRTVWLYGYDSPGV